MDLSPTHESARLEAARIPALHASLGLLVQGTEPNPASIALFATTRPAAGGDPGGAALVTMPMTASAGVVDEEAYQIQLTTPIEGQILGADETDGSIPTWARIYTPAGDWWADASVSVQGGSGEIQMVPTGAEGGQPVVRLFNGAFARLTSAVFGG